MAIDPRNIEVIDDDMVDVYRQMSGARRLKTASGMFTHARQMITNILRWQHSDWSEDQIRRETAKRLSHGAC
jgi:hypothetical protein